MKLVAFGVAAIAALAGTPAFAADIVFPSPPPVPPGWSFTGCYIGANGGAGWGDSNFSWTNITENPATAFNTGAATVLPEAANSSLDKAAFIGGGQVGCNYQPGWLVIGVEGDFDYMNVSVGRPQFPLATPTEAPRQSCPATSANPSPLTGFPRCVAVLAWQAVRGSITRPLDWR